MAAASGSKIPPNNSKRRSPQLSKKTSRQVKKLFVLDTNVLMHDPYALYRFEEHDVFVPTMTLEELDNNKKGSSEIARNAREVSRILDQLTSQPNVSIENGISLQRHRVDTARGLLYLQTKTYSSSDVALSMGKADNQIIGVVFALKKEHSDCLVVLVSKDINMRIKARLLGLSTEDYTSDQVLEDADVLYTGMRKLPENFWEKHGEGVESWKKDDRTFYRLKGALTPKIRVSECVFLEDGTRPFYAIVREDGEKGTLLEVIRDYTQPKNSVWGITARNREQNFALNLLMDPEIDFVTLLGQAGTGKTLLTLAAGLQQVIEQRLYSEIIFTRVTVSVGEDIGFLPGTEEEKMKPWMGALYDNLEVLTHTDDDDKNGKEWNKTATNDIILSRIKVKSMNFMRGRTFLNKYLIVDEAQNLTPKQMKTLITRAGPGTKVVCLGNIAQIDTPYLSEGSSGLTYVVDHFKGWEHSGHITLARGERSRLADHAAEVL